jgi:octaheme c-type cytochrome (tetrathionate reductase family)
MLRTLLHAGFVIALATAAYGQSDTPVTEGPQSTIPKLTADHAKFKKLQGPFASASDVTKACLTCHNEAGKQVTQSIHWTWETHNPSTGQTLGKKTVLNSFCGNLATNEPRCTSCHAGYGWTDTKTFDFKDETKVDCLACHDKTGEYIKWPTDAGHPLYTPKTQSTRMEPYAEALVVKEPDGTFTHLPPDLAKVAANVGRPGRDNCGNCHFFGGGGDNVKHGDLSTALLNPSPHVDVHMSPDGANMVCVDCHVGDGHEWPGSRYQGTLFDTSSKRAGRRNTDVLACNSCHTSEPHAKLSLKGAKLNDHTDRVACQTCHIPEFAKGGVATKTWWDWSTAGKLKDGKPYAEEDEKGRHTYLSIKGDFEWGEDVVPDYAFWNGRVDYTLLGDKIDPTGIVGINRIGGGADVPGSVIFPFKRMRGKQAYDAINNYLIQSNVYGPEGDTALWSNYDWDKALAAGMAASNVPYSGKFGFVETEMWWPTTHMVAPANEALQCDSCHAKDGRLAKVAGLYIPGRDGFAMTDRVGLILLALALVGIAGHLGLRILTRRNKKGD